MGNKVEAVKHLYNINLPEPNGSKCDYCDGSQQVRMLGIFQDTNLALVVKECISCGCLTKDENGSPEYFEIKDE